MSATMTVLTGIKPTGPLHIGNYLGAIRPANELARRPEYRPFLFIADYHALTLTGMRDPAEFRRYSREVAAGWLALGLDTSRTVFYRQSDIPEVFELAWILSCTTPKGLMDRAHAYKAAVQQNAEVGADPDAGVNMGLYNYPILMAADILLLRADLVPVGRDQAQHLEFARDIAQYFNAAYRPVLTLPEPLIRDDVAVIAGTDGRKMSKSYRNVIPLFAPPQELRKSVMRIVTDSSAPEEPKDPATSILFAIYREFAAPEQVEAMRERYRVGVSWGEVKEELFSLLDSFLSGPRRTYEEYMANPDRIEAILREGAERARAEARPVIEDMRRAIGRT